MASTFRLPCSPISITSEWNGTFVKCVARHKRWLNSPEIGFVQGTMEEGGAAELEQIFVNKAIKIRSGLFGRDKIDVPTRHMGIGSRLLECFEGEMAARGIREIHGRLARNEPAKIQPLVEWYEHRGYRVELDAHSGASQVSFAGRITKNLKA